MKKIILPLFILAFAAKAFSQDEAIFSHYNITPILINPAVAGFDDAYQLQFNARAQWTGFPDAPTTLGIMYNGPIGNTFGIGLGLRTEKAAQLNRLRGQLNFAFRFPFSDNFKFGVGFTTEFQQLQLDNSFMGSNFYQEGDQIVENAMNGQREFDASLGFWGEWNERTYVGLSFSNLVGARLDEIVTNNSTKSPFQYYLLTFGHRLDINDYFGLEPSVLIRQVRNSPFQIDFNLKASFLEDEKLVAGVSYRTLGTFGVLLGTKVSKFQLFYTYDVSFQQFQQFNTGSHEVTVAFNFQRKRKIGYNRPEN